VRRRRRPGARGLRAADRRLARRSRVLRPRRRPVRDPRRAGQPVAQRIHPLDPCRRRARCGRGADRGARRARWRGDHHDLLARGTALRGAERHHAPRAHGRGRAAVRVRRRLDPPRRHASPLHARARRPLGRLPPPGDGQREPDRADERDRPGRGGRAHRLERRGAADQLRTAHPQRALRARR
jgi:hypothetical protein